MIIIIIIIILIIQTLTSQTSNGDRLVFPLKLEV